MKNKFYSLSFLFLMLFFFGIGNAQSQNKVKTTTKKAPDKSWLEMIQDPNVNFYAVQNAFNSYWQGRTDYKGNGYKVFKRWEYINESRVLPNGKLQSSDYVKKEFDKYMSKQAGVNKSANGTWSIVGPSQYFINNTGQPTGMGRINAIAFHPTDANTIYIGAPSGGIWKTTNGGTTWENLANNLPKLGVSSILIHPTDPNIIYIGTGDRDANDAPGIGVYKTIDGGNTWTQINNTMGNVIVGDMIMHPSDPNTILAATSGGIYKTTNAGATWSLKSGANNYKDIQFKPGDPTVVYAVRITTPSRFYRSTNTGDTWTQVTSGIPTSGIGSRMVIGATPANPDYVYLVQIKSTDGTFAGLLRSTDAGLNFSVMSTTPNIFDYACDGSGTSSQATYDLCITVDPVNANTVYVGSINTWKSTDGGATWNISTHWSSTCGGLSTAVHADHHVFGWNPNNGSLYLGHDGGITYTANGGSSWTEITGGLAISQLYRLGQGASNNNYTVIGLQDNGSGATVNGSTFYTTRGGDGTECAIDYNNSNYCYNTYVEGALSRSTTGPTGSYSNIGSEGTNGIDEAGPWVLPFFLHKTDPNTMFGGWKNVWRTNNVRVSPASSVSWTKISTGETTTCKVLEQSAADLNVIYVVRNGAMKRTDNANDVAANVVWTNCTLPDGLTPNDLKTHPTDANIVYAVAGYYAYKSTDKGMTWTDMDPNYSLPSLNNNTLVFDKNSNEGIYIGNQTGVWYKNATMTDWVLFSNGLPPVDVRELEIFYDPVGTQNKLKAATYGRGLWQSDLKETGILNPTDFTATTINIDKIDLNWTSSGNNVVLAYSTSPTFGTPLDGTTYAASSTIPGGGTVLYNGNSALFHHTGLTAATTYYYKLWSYDGGTVYSSGITANATTNNSVADFIYNANVSCNSSLTVNFTDASVGAYNSWAWDVDNNGTVDYTTQNPNHTYTSPGLYSVKLTINSGLASITKENLILVMSSAPTANTGCSLSSNSNSGNPYGIGISRFAIGDVDYTTSGSDGYYQNYECSKWTTLDLNTSYNVTIRTGTSNNEGAKVYIDYNDNGIFETAETVVSFPANKDGTRTLSFTTPSSGVVINKGLRLRVLSKFGSVPSNACDISSYGQAEDYTVYFFVVTHSVTTGTINSSLCQGAGISVPFTISGTYNAGNVFTAQLSDATGSFTSPLTIGTLTSTTAGTISASIPSATAYGTGYRIRVISSNPAITGTANSSDISINTNPTPVITGNLAFCAGNSTTLDAGAYSAYNWSPGGSTQTKTTLMAGTYAVTVTDANGCTGASAPVTTIVNALPTITLDGTTVNVASGVTTAALTYSATTESPDTYSIDYSATANGVGFIDVTNALLSPGQITLAVPAGAAPTTYTANLTVKNSNGCVSSVYPFTITVTGFNYTVSQDIGTTVMLTWPATIGAASYAIYYRVIGSTGSWTAFSMQAINYAKVSGLTPETTYEAKILAHNSSGYLIASSVTNTFTTAKVNFTTTLDMGTTLQITWTDFSPWATSYLLQYRKQGQTTWLNNTAYLNLTKLTNLLPETTYECRIVVYKGTAQYGTSAISTFTTGKIEFATSQDIGTTVKIAWTPFVGATPSSYNLQYRIGTGSWSGAPVYINPAKLINLLPETTYEIRVVLYIGTTIWGTSQSGSFTTGKTEFTKLADNGSSMQIGWTDYAPWATSYVLQYSRASVSSWVSATATSGLNTTITPLIASENYKVKLRVMIGTDLWGTSQEQLITRGAKDAVLTYQNQLSTFPNPFVEQINLDIEATKASTCKWNIYDMTGKLVLSGSNDIAEGNSNISLDASDLSSGVYMLNVIINNEKHSFRLLKQ